MLLAAGCAHTDAANSRLDAPTREVLSSAGIDPAALNCNSDVTYGNALWKRSKAAVTQIEPLLGASADKAARKKAARVILGEFVRLQLELLATHNLGAITLEGRGPGGGPLVLYRAGVMADLAKPNSCLRTLLGEGGVTHVVNLYAGHFPLHGFIAEEARISRSAGATHHGEARSERSWRELISKKARYAKNLPTAMARVAEIIKRRVLRPGGEAPRGHVLLHCGGGMHRTGMLFGVIRRCLNGDPMSVIEADYKVHTAYKGPDDVGGYEALNVQFIRDFDCKLLGEKKGE